MSASPEMRTSTPTPFLSKMASTLYRVEAGDDHEIPTTTTKMQQHDHKEVEEECQTPTTKEYKIPIRGSCPPAPKKTRPSLMVCRRRLEMDVKVVHVKHEDTNGLFRKLFAPTIIGKRKRCFIDDEGE